MNSPLSWLNCIKLIGLYSSVVMWRTWRCTGVINWPYPRLQTCPGVSWRVLTCSDVSRHVFLRIEIQQTEMAYMKRRCEYSALNLVGVYRISFTLKVSHFFFSQWHRLSLRTNGIYVEFPTTEVEIINYFEILAKLASLFFNKFLKRKKKWVFRSFDGNRNRWGVEVHLNHFKS